MKRLAVAVLVVLPLNASAEFTGVTCEPYLGDGWLENGYSGWTTYRIYAHFDDPDDQMFSGYGVPDHPFAWAPSGGTFYNDPVFGGLTAPIDLRLAGIWSNQWDTYVTIGTDTSQGDATGLSAGFADATGNLEEPFSTTNAGWFVTPDDEQSRPIDGRVLLAQMTVPCGDTVTGTFNVNVYNNGEFVEFRDLPLECGAGNVDCNENCIPDSLEIANGLSNDCDGNGVPDKCDENPCLRADLDCSGLVSFADILEILAGWGPCALCPEDIDEDGRVGFSDLLFVLSRQSCVP